jgi:hypothetical protein
MTASEERDLDAWADKRRIETRAEQGLPPTTDDPVAAAAVASNVGPWLDSQGERTSGGNEAA